MACPAAPLGQTLGSGKSPKIVLGAFLDIACPFSKRLYDRVTEVIQRFESDVQTKGKITFTVYHYVQPWHPQGTMMAEACIAVNRIAPDKYHPFMSSLFKEYHNPEQKVDNDNQVLPKPFSDEGVLDKTKRQIYEELMKLAEDVGVAGEELSPLLLGEEHDKIIVPILKFYTRFGRQNGVHVTPTVLCNGLENSTIASSWSADAEGDWDKYLKCMLENDLPKHRRTDER